MSEKKETHNEEEMNTTTTTKIIGGMTYKVRVHFSDTSKESLNDKVIRMIKSDFQSRAS